MSWLRRGGTGIACVALVALAGGSAAVRAKPPADPAATPVAVATAPAPPPPPPPVLAAPVAGPAQTAAGVARMLARPLADPRLGGRVAATVVDAETGEVLLDRSADTYVLPASTAKLVTAAAVLASGPPGRRLSTRLVAGARPGEVVLVGGGDGTLSAARGGRPTTYQGAARLATLAARARAAGLGKVTRVVVDGSLFTGPRLAPGWDPVDVAGGYVAPITAVMVDGGRQGPGVRARSAEPDLAAGRALAAALGAPTAPVVRGTAPAGARLLARVESQPVSRLVEQMLLASDNVLGGPAGPAGGAGRGPTGQLRRRGGRVPGGARPARAADRPAPGWSTAAGCRWSTGSPRRCWWRCCARPPGRTDRSCTALLSGLPVSGYDGTLDDRFRGPAAPAVGQVRAKTGTLTGISSLAGLVRGAGGRLLVFAVVADRVSPAGTLGAEAALDSVAAALARCGCA